MVEKSGAWFSFDESVRLGQGRENSKAFLKADQEMATTRSSTPFRENSGLIAERILEEDRQPERHDAEEA